MKYYNVTVTHVTDCVIQANSEEEAVDIASNIDCGDCKLYEAESNYEISNEEIDNYKRNADYISEE